MYAAEDKEAQWPCSAVREVVAPFARRHKHDSKQNQSRQFVLTVESPASNNLRPPSLAPNQCLELTRFAPDIVRRRPAITSDMHLHSDFLAEALAGPTCVLAQCETGSGGSHQYS